MVTISFNPIHTNDSMVIIEGETPSETAQCYALCMYELTHVVNRLKKDTKFELKKSGGIVDDDTMNALLDLALACWKRNGEEERDDGESPDGHPSP